jgi:hypothetical protein
MSYFEFTVFELALPVQTSIIHLGFQPDRDRKFGHLVFNINAASHPRLFFRTPA